MQQRLTQCGARQARDGQRLCRWSLVRCTVHGIDERAFAGILCANLHQTGQIE